jgi:chromate transporter
LSDAARVWARVALLSFGGPAGQIAVMHRIIVDEKKWVSESRFMHALNYCMLLQALKRSNSPPISVG